MTSSVASEWPHTPAPWRTWAGYAAFLLPISLILMMTLDHPELWTDEAETGLVAEGILQRGIPSLPDDGSIHYPFQLGWLNSANVWVVTPWLDEYLAAGSFLVFGVHPWSGRLPFVVCGLLTAVVLMRVAWLMYQDHRYSFVAGLLYLTCPAVLIFARQMRYYSVSALAQAILMLGLFRTARGDRRAGIALLSTGMLAQFYTNYLPLIANLACLGVLTLGYWRRLPRLAWCVAASCGVLGLFAAPWLYYAGRSMFASIDDVTFLFTGGVASDRKFGDHWLQTLLFYAWTYADWLPVGLLAIPPTTWCIRQFRSSHLSVDRKVGVEDSDSAWGRAVVESFAWLMLPISLVVMSRLPFVIPRYIQPFIVPLTLLIAATLVRHVRPGWLRWTAVAVAASTGILRHPFAPNRWIEGGAVVLAAGVLEPTGPTRVEQISGYLNKHASASDVILLLADDLPMTFYLKPRTLVAQRWRADTNEAPNWIIPQRFGRTVDEAYGPPPKSLLGEYEEILLDVDVDDPDVVERGLYPRRTRLFHRRGAGRRVGPGQADGDSRGYPVYLLKSSQPGTVARIEIVPTDPSAVRVRVHRLDGITPESLRLRKAATSREILLGGGYGVEKGRPYEIRFRARADRERTVVVTVVAQEPPAQTSEVRFRVSLGREWEGYSLVFASDLDSSRAAIEFLLGGDSASVEVVDAEIVALEGAGRGTGEGK